MSRDLFDFLSEPDDKPEPRADAGHARPQPPHDYHRPCRSCGKRVLWLMSCVSRQTAPIDPDPSPDGNVVVNGDGTYDVLGGKNLAQAQAAGLTLHASHFATCPNGPTHRRRKK
ncbi:MAG TPA: hypothetical protein VM529_15930 [Gemmata sp.]|jgi:hypothetical protein|nr:hypothetical protein [Gemmata sp.]